MCLCEEQWINNALQLLRWDWSVALRRFLFLQIMTLKHEHCVKWNVKTVCCKLVPSLFCQLCHPGGGGGWVGGTQIHPDPGKRLSNTLTSEVSALLYILLQVLYRLSTKDSSATWLTTGKHLLWIAITKQSNPPISLFCKTAQSEKWVNNMAWYHVENHIWVQKNRLTETSSFSTDCKISDQLPQTSYFSFLREN